MSRWWCLAHPGNGGDGSPGYNGGYRGKGGGISIDSTSVLTITDSSIIRNMSGSGGRGGDNAGGDAGNGGVGEKAEGLILVIQYLRWLEVSFQVTILDTVVMVEM